MAEAFVRDLFGWRAPGVSNSADGSSAASKTLGAAVNKALGVTRTSTESGQTLGSMLEQGVRAHLEQQLPTLDPGRVWHVETGARISQFNQFRHLASVQAVVANTPVLRTTVGMDYLITVDVVVWHEPPAGAEQPPAPVLHAAVSCKWSIRSDRVQNTRHEFLKIVHNRRARTPHLVCVTAEPLPSRIAAIARGTGEVDATYHVAFEELAAAVAVLPNTDEQRRTWDELVAQERLLPFKALALALIAW